MPKKIQEVPLYTLVENDMCLIQGKQFRVTATRQVKKEGSNSFQSFYLRQVNGKEFVFAPAGLMVSKVN